MICDFSQRNEDSTNKLLVFIFPEIFSERCQADLTRLTQFSAPPMAAGEGPCFSGPFFTMDEFHSCATHGMSFFQTSGLKFWTREKQQIDDPQKRLLEIENSQLIKHAKACENTQSRTLLIRSTRIRGDQRQPHETRQAVDLQVNYSQETYKKTNNKQCFRS